MKLVADRLNVWLLMAVMLIASVLPTFGEITLNPTNAFSTAEGGFNHTGAIGLGMLTISVLVGAMLFGWRLKSRGR